MPDDPIEEAARVAAALSGFTSCAFCGAEFRKDVDAAKIREHVLHCPKHPIAEMMDKAKGFKKVADAYDEEHTRVRKILDEEEVPKMTEDHRMYSLSERVRLLAHKTHMSMKATLAFESDLQELMARVRFEGDPKEL